MGGCLYAQVSRLTVMDLGNVTVWHCLQTELWNNVRTERKKLRVLCTQWVIWWGAELIPSAQSLWVSDSGCLQAHFKSGLKLGGSLAADTQFKIRQLASLKLGTARMIKLLGTKIFFWSQLTNCDNDKENVDALDQMARVESACSKFSIKSNNANAL